MKYDGNCLHGARPGSPGDCTLPRKDGSVLCEFHHEQVVAGREKAPPLLMTHDYQPSARKTFLVYPGDKED